MASDSLFNGSGNPLAGPGLGAFALDAEPLAEAVCALPFNLSVAWATFFSNLTLPVGVYGRLASDPTVALDFQDGVAALPPESGVAGEDRMTSFNDWSSLGDYWDLEREPLASLDIRNWVAESAVRRDGRDWAIASLTGNL